MAAFTSSQTGNWSSSSTWGGSGVPGTGDTVTIGSHAVTVDSAVTVGTGTGTAISMTGNASGRLLINAALMIKGDIVHNQSIGSLNANPTVEIAAGVTVTFDATAGRCKWQFMSANSQYTWVRSNGTSNSRCAITATGGDFYFSRSSFVVGGYYEFNYTDISNCYDGTRYAYTPWSGNAGGPHKIKNCTLTASGEWNVNGTPHAASSIDFSGTTFNNSRGTYCLYFTGGATTYTHTGCVFIATKQVGMPNQINVVWDKCYFNIIPEVSGTTGLGHAIKNSFIRKATNTPLTMGIPETFDNNYVYFDDSAQADPHIMQFASLSITLSATNNVIESNGNSNTQGDAFDANSGTGTKNIRYNLILKCLNGTTASGFLFGALGATGQTYNIDHNTVVGGLSNTPVYMGDAYNPHTGMIGSLRSNLIGSDASATYPFFWNRFGDEAGTVQDDVITSVGNNNVYGGRTVTNTGTMSTSAGTYSRNLKSSSGTYYGTPQTTNPAATDTQILPVFLDPTRRLTTWAVTRGYATSGQTQAQKESAAYTALQGAPTTLIADLQTWVKEGYAPRNAEFKGTAHDGGDIGAIPVATAVPLFQSHYRQQGIA